MAVEPSILAVVASRRFGLGARPGDLARFGADPRGMVLADLDDAEKVAIPSRPGLMSSPEAMLRQRLAEEQRRRQRLKLDLRPLPGADLHIENKVFAAEAQARFRNMLTAPVGFVERLVLFWSNHFCVAVSKSPALRTIAGAFEREVVRTHVAGKFGDMLRAAEQHPAMLFYLDNNVSTGPKSRRSPTGKGGLNENLAREILELHTLGVAGGYSQQDVIALARIISGWTFDWPENDALQGGRFTFAFGRHEPGDHTLMGRVFPDDGVKQGEAALDFLATHPATARHIARKLAAHFVSDDPPPALVERLTKTFLDSGGDLKQVSQALVTAPEAWEPKPLKIRSPVEFTVAAARAVGKPDRMEPILPMLQSLGQPLWDPGGPNGFPDTNAHWASPVGLKARLDLSAGFGELASTVDPVELIGQVLGPVASRETREAVKRAESRPQGLAILLMAPEFQRR